MNLRDIRRMLDCLGPAASEENDRPLSSSEILEIISVASGLLSEAVVMAKDATTISTKDDWILNALVLIGENELFNSAFVELCRMSKSNFSVLYGYCCQFIYRDMIRGGVNIESEVELRALLDLVLSRQVVDRIFLSLKNSGLLSNIC